jgi:dTDP-4-dehydrorhamnose reductase
MRTTIVGANGQLGGELVRVFRSDGVMPLGPADVDVCHPERLTKTNGLAISTLARACHQCRALLVQPSTDYVFDGTGTRPKPGPTR